MSFEERSSLENNIFLNPYVKTFYQEEKKDLQNKIKKIIQTFADEDSLASPCIDIVLSYVVPKTHSEEILLAKNLMMTPLFLSVAASQPEKNLHESDQAKINPIKNSI
jgi:mannose/fructose/N-acetylgalactosamine-specific phosphotransferase system component IID